MGFLNFFRWIYYCISMKPRYHIDKVNYDFDKYASSVKASSTGKKLTTLKFDMSYITGSVYCGAGTIGYHENGKKDGIHKRWDTDRVSVPMVYTGLWSMGNREGSHKWYDKWDGEGYLEREINYKNDMPDGTEKEWYNNGQLMKHIEWKDGIILTSKQWNRQGNLLRHTVGDKILVETNGDWR